MSSKEPIESLEWPKISIITPSFNQAEFLERTIKSVLDQNYANLEYILIDGGSTDGSVDIIKRYSDSISYWISKKDSGQTEAINKGFKLATGEIVAWLNSDDEYCEGTLERVAKTFMSDSHLDFVFGDRLSIDRNGNILRDDRHTRFSFTELILHGMILTQPSSFWKRELFGKYGYLDETKRFCMDYEFFCRIGQHIKAKHICQPLSCFRWHEDSKSLTIQDVRLSEHTAIAASYLDSACGPWPIWLVRLYMLISRTFWYIVQGDLLYVLRGIIRRMLPAKYRPRSL